MIPTDPSWNPALTGSRVLKQWLESDPALADVLVKRVAKPLAEDELVALLHPRPENDEAMKRLLRQMRRQALAQIALRDLCARAPLAEVVESMTLLADVTTNAALAWAHRQLAAVHGEPLDRNGQPQRLIVVGMGKLGGRELNVSSDVDYIFVYPEDGETAGPRVIECFDFFTRLGKRLVAALNDITADGQVFRVDMRLRPNGDSGPLVCSLDALENYFVTQGREWERYAWIKARVMNTGENEQSAWMSALQRIVRPFVYRKYLDFGAINAMRGLHAQIRREVARKDRIDHIKLGPGGIREIEFIAQVFQLIRGGRDTALQVRPTLSVIKRLTERQMLSAEASDELAAAYDFLRRLEHRLQYLDDRQTHDLPHSPQDQACIAENMGFADWPALLAVLDAHRQRVSRHFEAVFSDPESGEPALTGVWLGQTDEDRARTELEALGYRESAAVLDRLAALRESARYQQLPASNRERLDAVGPRLLEAAAATADPDTALQRTLSFVETIARRGAYLALLQQYPHALRRLSDIMAASSWAATYLGRHPLLLDELLSARIDDEATDWPAFRQQLEFELGEHAGDAEREMDILREQHHAQVFRLLARDLAGRLPVEQLSDHLSELADILLAQTLPLCWSKLKQRHRDTPRFAIIGYGKLGGKELGYASDLDLVYLYEDDDPDAPEIYTRLGQRVNTWLSSQTSAGLLFETDLRLRPNGDSGLLVVSLAAFRDYQLEKAWIWEHQALTRARFVAGDAALGAGFEAIRREILGKPRDLLALRDEVLSMRQKMLAAHASKSSSEFDLKHDPGGIVDVEFIVQFLVLGHASRYPQLADNIGNIGLLARAAELSLIPVDQARSAQAAYREYRRLQHQKRLNDTPLARLPRTRVERHMDAVGALWKTVFF